MICPKCGHKRRDKDDPNIPDYQCPACDVIYEKYRPSKAATIDTEKREESDLEKLAKIREQSASFDRVKNRQINQQKIIEYVFWFIIATSIFSYVFIEDSPKESYAPKPIKTPYVKTHQENINLGFSIWDGSHRQLVKLIKMEMNDPSSFDHVETKYIDNGNGTLNVLMKYRGKNAFGAIVLDSVKVRTNINSGEVVDVIE